MDEDLRALRRRLEQDPGDAAARGAFALGSRRTGGDPFIAAAYEAGAALAPSKLEAIATSTGVLALCGGTPAGREAVAWALHAQGPVEVDDRQWFLGSVELVPATLLEAQVFGYCKGAFTGQSSVMMGMLELGSTVLLDRIDRSPLLTPARARALRSGQFVRIGESRPRPLRARLVVGLDSVELVPALGEIAEGSTCIELGPARPQDDPGPGAHRSRIELLASGRGPVLVLGGDPDARLATARELHAASALAARRFVQASAPLEPTSAFAVDLFGGVERPSREFLRHASGGTLFIDAIERLPEDGWRLSSLLGGRFRRVGEDVHRLHQVRLVLGASRLGPTRHDGIRGRLAEATIDQS
jgi:DNA-binding NtrC family response regulator